MTQANSDPTRLHQPEVKLLADSMGVPLAQPVVAQIHDVLDRVGLAGKGGRGEAFFLKTT